MELKDLGIGDNGRRVKVLGFARLFKRCRAAFLDGQRAEFGQCRGALTELLGYLAVEGHGEAGQEQ